MPIKINAETNESDFERASRTHAVARAMRNLAIAIRAATHFTSHELNSNSLCELASSLEASYVVEAIDDDRKNELFTSIYNQLGDESLRERTRSYVSEWDEFDWVSFDRETREED